MALHRLAGAVLAAALASGAPGAGAAEPDGVSSMAGVESDLELKGHRALRGVRENTPDPAPFTTDGCSGGLSDVWAYVAKRFPAFAEAHQARPPWEACCVIHDRAYHRAGWDLDPERSYDNRLEADRQLRACVLATADARATPLGEGYGLTPEQVEAAYSAIAQAMYVAVRLGGGPCTDMPWRWGYGYSPCDRTSD
jgi:hypothetical protein